MIDEIVLVRTFLAVLESGSFSAAAPGMFRSHAAMRAQLAVLN
jgi:DNA-binding transcriptional LysR family regulator